MKCLPALCLGLRDSKINEEVLALLSLIERVDFMFILKNV